MPQKLLRSPPHQAGFIRAAEKLYPADVADRVNKHGHTHIAITYPNPSPLAMAPAKQRLISHFSSKADIVEAVGGSVFIPYWSGDRLTTQWVGRE